MKTGGGFDPGNPGHQYKQRIDKAFVENLVNLAIQIQQVPAPTFQELKRAKFVHDLFLREGLQDVYMDSVGNVYGCLKGPGQTGARKMPPVVITAHLDTVFPMETDLAIRREKGRILGPGIGDNSLGVAGLLGLVWLLHHENGRSDLPGDMWLVANVGEEGLGNLRGMTALVDCFGKNVLAYIVLEGLSLGQVYHKGLGVTRFRITAQTPGGHSWVDYGRPSAIHELAGLITRLTNLHLAKLPRTTLNIGMIQGGTSINTIASEASLELDLRSEKSEMLADLVRQVKQLVSDANRKNVEMTCELIGERPGGKIEASHPLVRAAQRSLEAQGIKHHLSIGSTDANLPLSRGYPAVCVGLTRGGGAHTNLEYFLEEPLHKGMSQLCLLVTTLFQEANKDEG